MNNFSERVNAVFSSNNLSYDQAVSLVSKSAADKEVLDSSLKKIIQFKVSHKDICPILTLTIHNLELPINKGNKSKFSLMNKDYVIECIGLKGNIRYSKLYLQGQDSESGVSIQYPIELRSVFLTPLMLFMTNSGKNLEISYNHIDGDKRGIYWIQVYDYNEDTGRMYSRRTKSIHKLVRDFNNWDLIRIKRELDSLDYVENAFSK